MEQLQTAPAAHPATCFVNRELSWLKFNERVLEEAERPRVPLCERLTFLSIFQSNLDEFFMVRIGSLKDHMGMGPNARDNKTGMAPEEQWESALHEIARLELRRGAAYHDLMGELQQAGVRIVDFRTVSDIESTRLQRYFEQELLPLLSPIIVGKRQPFPFLRNKDIYAVAELEQKKGKRKIGLIPCGTGVFPRLIRITEGEYMLSEELILHFIPTVFRGYQIRSKSLVRITRSADIDADARYDEDLDYREFMQDIIRERRRLEPVRMELSRQLSEPVIESLCRSVGLCDKEVFLCETPLDLSFLSALEDNLRQREDFFYPSRSPQKTAQFRANEPFLPQVLEKDKLLSFPFDRINPFLLLLHEAAVDPKVVSIKMTLYRVAKQSQVVNALIEAAENGKEVLVLVELKARFDEENNIEWSRRLEKAGCNVIYGLPRYKVHSKLCLISRMDDGKPQYITQIGTGNYNEKTARLYTDFSLMTADQTIGQDAAAVFQALAKGETVQQSNELLVAPNCLQNNILSMIDNEIAHAQRGEAAYIGIKVNSLTDKAIMDRLIAASQAGVKIDMVVRGICCLLPGVPGLTENIRIISIVGRFLEHSRIYLFGCGEREKIYIASADLMTRNTLRRVEVAVPIHDATLREQLRSMFQIMLRDNMQARELQPDGQYVRVPTEGEPIDSQAICFDKAYEQAQLLHKDETIRGQR
ncbi:MAG: polyphosphate kinase 1 [Eubacteriales bacterium]|nr:polyphosphate kinase 1 [Eubacteriales bacterium]